MALLAVVFIGTCLPVQAAFSGLAIIPTADMTATGEYALSLQPYGTFSSSATESYYFNTQFGLSDRIEFGIDVDLSDDAENRLLGNAKVLLSEERGAMPAFAAGVYNLVDGEDAAAYLVASRTLAAIRGHAGAVHADDTLNWFVGVDGSVSDTISLMADYTAGDGNASSVAMNYQMTDTMGIMAGAIFPNEGGNTEYTVYFCFNGCIFHR